MSKPTVLILLAHYLPGIQSGGPQTTISNMVDLLSPEYDFKIITYDRDSNDIEPYKTIEPEKWNQFGKALVYYVTKNKYALYKIVKIINNTNFDILYVNPLFEPVYSFSIIFLRKIGLIKAKNVVLAPRGELFDEALAIKPTKKKLFLKFYSFVNLQKNVRWHASTYEELDVIVRNAKVEKKNIHVAKNLSIINKATLTNLSSIKENYIGEEKVLYLIYASRIARDKNTLYIFEILSKINQVNIVFDIYGPIRDEKYWEQCLSISKEFSANIKMNYKGSLQRDEVVNTISKYDVFCLPTFAENFGHAIVEAFAAGTPALISDNTPWQNLESMNIGWDINLTKKNSFAKVLTGIANLSKKEKLEMKYKVLSSFEKIKNMDTALEDNINLFKNMNNV